MNPCTEEVLMYDKNKVRVIALSGGVDSMYLYKQLKKVYKDNKEGLVVAHVNHNLREESKKEETYLREQVKEDGHRFYSVSVDVVAYCKEQGSSVETGARDLRYAFFREVMEEVQAEGIYFAHHGDDLVETMLMRMVAGSGRKGLIAMQPQVKRAGYWYLRPLLAMSKQEIYEAMEGEVYFEDSSNQSDEYKRNRYRKLLPELKKENAKVHQAFLRMSKEMCESETYWYDQYEQKKEHFLQPRKLESSNQVSEYLEINLVSYQSYPQYEQKQYMKYIAQEVGLSTLSTKNREELLDIANNQEPFKDARAFLNGFKVMRYKNTLEIRKPCYELVKEQQEQDRLNEGYRLVEKPKEERVNGKRLNKYVIERQPIVDKRSPLYEKNGNYVYRDGTPV